jgi:TPR repeat protein
MLASMFERGLGIALDLVSAQHWLEQAARQGHIKSQWRLYRWLKRAGHGAAALRWLEAAAEGGDPHAQYKLARHHLKLGAETSKLRAFVLFGRAAKGGHARAAYCLGVCHYRGVGTRPDPLEAYRCFKRAAQLGSPAALTALQSLSGRLGPDPLTHASGPAN